MRKKNYLIFDNINSNNIVNTPLNVNCKRVASDDISVDFSEFLHMYDNDNDNYNNINYDNNNGNYDNYNYNNIINNRYSINKDENSRNNTDAKTIEQHLNDLTSSLEVDQYSYLYSNSGDSSSIIVDDLHSDMIKKMNKISSNLMIPPPPISYPANSVNPSQYNKESMQTTYVEPVVLPIPPSRSSSSSISSSMPASSSKTLQKKKSFWEELLPDKDIENEVVLALEHFNSVVEFNNVFEVYHYTDELDDIFRNAEDHVIYRYSLVEEEINELKDAVLTNNYSEIIDALIDIIYVIYGMQITIGAKDSKSAISVINYYDKSFIKLHELNKESMIFYDMVSKMYLHANSIHSTSDITIESKIELESKSKLLRELSKLTFTDKKFPILKNKEIVKHFVNKILDLNLRIKDSIKQKDIVKVVMLLGKLLQQVYTTTIVFNIDVNKAFNIVHNSNMSKVCSSEKEAKMTVEHYKVIYRNGDLKYDSPEYRKSKMPGKWIVYNKSTTKILKSIDYKPANFDYMLQSMLLKY